jgi:hypothetical protein
LITLKSNSISKEKQKRQLQAFVDELTSSKSKTLAAWAPTSFVVLEV